MEWVKTYFMLHHFDAILKSSAYHLAHNFTQAREKLLTSATVTCRAFAVLINLYLLWKHEAMHHNFLSYNHFINYIAKKLKWVAFIVAPLTAT